MTWLDWTLRAAAVSQLTFITALLLRGSRPLSMSRWMALGFVTSTAACMVISAPQLTPSWFLAPIGAFSGAAPVFFWWFAAVVFQNTFRLRAYHWAALTITMALTLVSTAPIDVEEIAAYVPAARAVGKIASLAFVLLGLWITFRNRTDD